MSGRLENKVAVITGGITEIGFATAKRFVTEGASVFLTGRRAPELNRAAEMLGPHAVPVLADSSNLDDLDRLYELIRREAGRSDILLANAGGGPNLPLGSITEEQYDDTLGRNVKRGLFTVQKALPLLVDAASVILTA
jgi:NAD(P)-dependent dehydrogenase (short-subunit alcohol dehydrogenase family)